MNIDSIKQLLKAKKELQDLIDSIQDIDIDYVINEGSFDPYLKYEDSIFTSWYAEKIASPEDFDSISEFNSFQPLKDFYDKMFGYYGDFVLLANSPIKKSLFSSGASKRKSSFEKLLEKTSKASEKLFSEIQLFIDTYGSYDEIEEQEGHITQVIDSHNGDSIDSTEQELQEPNDAHPVIEQEISEEENQDNILTPESEDAPLHEEIEEVEEKNIDNDLRGDLSSGSKIEESNSNPVVSVSPDEKALQESQELIDKNEEVEQEVITEKGDDEQTVVKENDSLEEFKRKMQEDFEKQIKNLDNNEEK